MATLSSVGRALGGILSNPAEKANKCLFASSFTPSQNEILAILENHSGKWTVEKIGIAEAVSEGLHKPSGRCSRNTLIEYRPDATTQEYVS